MTRQEIINTIQNNPRAKVGQGENIFVPLTVNQRNVLREARKEQGRMRLNSIENNARYV